jgi:3-deoxy-7-phosphoheptulonate synthase
VTREVHSVKIALMKNLATPKELKELFPLETKQRLFIQKTRKKIQNILLGKEKRKLLIVGPCSIHDELSTLEYAKKLQKLSEKVKNFLLVLRFFIEKPRTSLGWTGYLTDPFLDGSGKIDQGLLLSRKLLMALAQENIPCAMEFLHPSFVPYFVDGITWGVIGSRTSSSQIHRQMASLLPFPVGFKNSQNEAIDTTLQSILAARAPHTLPTIDEEGRITSTQSLGNLFAHLVLRGNRKGPNYDERSLSKILNKSKQCSFPLKILIDCSHENSSKILEKQKECFLHFVSHPNPFVVGAMLESHLKPGNQKPSMKGISYGLSITDPCLGWEETQDLIRFADKTLGK